MQRANRPPLALPQECLLELETVNLPMMNVRNNFDNEGADNLRDVDERGNIDDELEQLPDVSAENYGPELNAERLHRLQQNDPNFTSVRITWGQGYSDQTFAESRVNWEEEDCIAKNTHL